MGYGPDAEEDDTAFMPSSSVDEGRTPQMNHAALRSTPALTPELVEKIARTCMSHVELACNCTACEENVFENYKRLIAEAIKPLEGK